MIPWRLAACIVVALLAFSSTARAQDQHPLVALGLDACLVTDAAAVRRIVGIELGGLLANEASEQQDLTRVQVSCLGPVILINVDDAVTGKSLQRRLDFSTQPESARVRLLGLAVAELVVASWIELQTKSNPDAFVVNAKATQLARLDAVKVVRDRLPPATISSSTATVAATTPVSIAAVGGVRGLANGLSFKGAGAAVSIPLTRRWAFAFDVVAEGGTQRASLGTVSVRMLTGAPRVVLSTHIERLELQAGAGVRMGVARMTGLPSGALPTRASTLTGPWGGPVLTIAATAHATRWLAIALSAETGVALFRITAQTENRDDVELSGAWGALFLSIAFKP